MKNPLHERRLRAARARLAAAAAPVDGAVTHAAIDAAGLPPPVARYLKRTLPDGTSRVGAVRLKQRGEFRLGADKPWMPFEAEEDFTLATPGFLWSARMRMPPGVPVYVLDSLVAGRGEFGGRLAGLVSVVHGTGPEADRSSAIRYLSELPWAPQALAPGGPVRWTPIDERKARAHLGDVSGEFGFDAEGRIVSFFTDQRFRDVRGRPERADWGGDFADHRRVGGVEIPGRGVVRWLLPEGPLEYCRIQIVE